MPPSIALFTANQGHLSLAQAAQQNLDGDFRFSTFYQPILMEDTYVFFYRQLPRLFWVPYRLSQARGVREMIWKGLYQRYESEVLAFLNQQRPQVIITSYFGYNPVLIKYANEHHIPLINIIANPVTTHFLEVVPAPHYNLCFDTAQVKQIHQLHPHSVAQPTGWLVRPQFTPLSTTAQAKLRTQLDLHPQRQTWTLIGGSEGAPQIEQIVKEFGQLQHLQLIVVCGRNQRMFEQLTAQNLANVKTVGFTQDLHLYIQAADVVIGKAGPNTLFESVAAHKPFVAITHVKGQEDGNIDLIRQHSLGWVAEKPTQASRLLESLATQPHRLTKIAPALHTMAEYNNAAAKHLRHLVTTLCHNHSSASLSPA